jgi:hypothetical protein
MKAVAGVTAGSLVSWLAAAALVDRDTAIAILFGMLGPLFSVTVTWVLAERIYQRNPGALTSLMVMSFAGKLVFFGAYVAAMLRVLSVRPAPFVVCFTGYFIVLYLIEALHLRRLFWGGMRASR